MANYKYKLIINNLGYERSSYEDELKKHYYEILNEVEENFKDFYFQRNDTEVQLTVNWTTAVKDYISDIENNLTIDELIKHYESNKSIYNSFNDLVKERSGIIPENSYIIIQVFTSLSSKIIIDQVVKNFIYHLFLVLNISCPGFLDLYSAKLVLIDIENKEIELESIKLSSYPFELVWLRESWPLPRFVPIRLVKEWYDKKNLWGEYLGKNKLEKSLFCLLHFCEEDKISPSKIIWLAHALEAIYNIPPSAILHSLKERIMIIHSKNEDSISYKKITRLIKDFYQYRSDFVHGNLNIFIPSEEILEGDDQEGYVKTLFETEEFAFNVLLATIQKMVLDGRYELNFKTVLIED